jgi:hypothetical protein
MNQEVGGVGYGLTPDLATKEQAGAVSAKLRELGPIDLGWLQTEARDWAGSFGRRQPVQPAVVIVDRSVICRSESFGVLSTVLPVLCSRRFQ